MKADAVDCGSVTMSNIVAHPGMMLSIAPAINRRQRNRKWITTVPLQSLMIETELMPEPSYNGFSPVGYRVSPWRVITLHLPAGGAGPMLFNGEGTRYHLSIRIDEPRRGRKRPRSRTVNFWNCRPRHMESSQEGTDWVLQADLSAGKHGNIGLIEDR